MPNVPLLHLNWRWRLADNGCHWIIERRTGRPTNPNGDFKSVAFHSRRDDLKDRIRDLCGPITREAEAYLAALPKTRPGWPQSPKRYKGTSRQKKASETRRKLRFPERLMAHPRPDENALCRR